MFGFEAKYLELYYVLSLSKDAEFPMKAYWGARFAKRKLQKTSKDDRASAYWYILIFVALIGLKLILYLNTREYM